MPGKYLDVNCEECGILDYELEPVMREIERSDGQKVTLTLMFCKKCRGEQNSQISEPLEEEDAPVWGIPKRLLPQHREDWYNH